MSFPLGSKLAFIFNWFAVIELGLQGWAWLKSGCGSPPSPGGSQLIMLKTDDSRQNGVILFSNRKISSRKVKDISCIKVAGPSEKKSGWPWGAGFLGAGRIGN